MSATLNLMLKVVSWTNKIRYWYIVVILTIGRHKYQHVPEILAAKMPCAGLTTHIQKGNKPWWEAACKGTPL